MSDLRILAVAAGRGGTGKSTLTYGIAHTLLSLKGMDDVAMLDLDPQAGLTTRAGKSPVADPIHEPAVDVHGITLYRGGRGLSQATDIQLAAHVERAVSEGSPAAAATRSVNWRTTASCLSRLSAPALVSTCTRT